MGNTLTSSNNNRNINDSILGKRIKEILLDQDIILDITLDKDGNEIIKTDKINKIRGCCMDIVKEYPTNNEFITVTLPDAIEETKDQCKNKGRCVNNSKLGLQIKGDRNKLCNKNFTSGTDGICNSFISNVCAKQMYESGCLKVTKNKNGKTVRVWNTDNSKCFNDDGSLIYGNEECACINSATGFSLNTDPSKSIKGGTAFKTHAENPYGINGDFNNNSSKYSLNIFGYDVQYQKPQLFDSRCASRIDRSSVLSGESAAYLLPGYDNKNLSICMSQINIKDSDIGTANLSNIKQNNQCGGPPPEIEEKPEDRDVDVIDDNKVDDRLASESEDSANQSIDHNKKMDQVKQDETADKINQLEELLKQEKEFNNRLDKISNDQNIKDEQYQSIIDEQENEIKNKEQLYKDIKEINKLLKEKPELINKEKKEKQELINKEKQELINKEKESFKRKLYYAFGFTILILILIFIILKIKNKNNLDAKIDAKLSAELDAELNTSI